MSTSIRPIKTKIVIKPDLTDFKSEGGIIVPDSLRTRCNRGKVVAVGEGTKNCPMEYEVGYTVWHIKGGGVEIKENGELFVILDTADKNVIKGYTKN